MSVSKRCQESCIDFRRVMAPYKSPF